MFQFPLHRDPRCNRLPSRHLPSRLWSFSSLYIGILAATAPTSSVARTRYKFQFPLHRDPRCNNSHAPLVIMFNLFQFPLHRDPRCNPTSLCCPYHNSTVSVPFTSGSSLQLEIPKTGFLISTVFQFPLHRDPRCNVLTLWIWSCRKRVSVPFTSGSSLQPDRDEEYGIAVKFQFPLHRDPRCNVEIS